MEELALVVMAAGMGSRFGGPKQIIPVDDDGNFIIDYSIYDAIKTGFKKVVLIIKEEDRHIFESTIGSRLEGHIDIEYAYQNVNNIPSQIDISARLKPWGTVQAVLASKPYVNGSFLVINADDFYGRDAYKIAYDFLKSTKDPYKYASITYQFNRTVWGNEEVKRGVSKLKDGKITEIVESSIKLNDKSAYAKPLDGTAPYEIPSNQPVSMNMFAFQNDIYEVLEKYFEEYFKQSTDDILNGEALLTEALKENIENNKIEVYGITTDSKWMGMTYQEDLVKVREEIQKLKKLNVYPEHLWK